MEMPLELSLPSLEGLTPVEIRSMIIPHILRFTTASPPPEHPRDIMVLVDPTNRSITFFEGPFNPEVIFHEEGPLPASKASIEAMPVVKVLDEGTDCTICLSDFEIDGEAKEMPCRHHFHSICIDKWLGINGSCPICRYKMPVDKEGDNKDEENHEVGREGEDERGDDGGREMDEDRMLLVFHVVVRQDTTGDSDLTTVMISEVQRNSEDIDARDGDEFDAGDGDESEARDGNQFEAGVADEFEAGDGDESESQAMITDNN